MGEIKKDKNGWIDGNIFNPFYIENKKYQNELLFICDDTGSITVNNPCSNSFPIKNFWWKFIEYPVNLINR